jgi:hypothetical protein
MRNRGFSVWTATTVLAFAGCAKETGREDSGIDTLVTATAMATDATSNGNTETTMDEGSTVTTEPDEDSDSGNDSGDPVFDLGIIPDTPVQEMGCDGVDFLFAIDNSGSMGAQQGQLLASFPGFISAIQNSLEDVSSYHVGVVTSDAYTANEVGCQTLGDLVTQTQAHGACGPFVDGGRFATDADDLATVFPCMAEVGSGGSFIEQPVSASVAAVSEAKAAVGACNEGFLRDDSILVLVVLTDDPPYDPDVDDAHPSTDTSGWYQAIIDAKGGNPEAVVVIGFIPWSDISCVPLTVESPNLINFVDSFGDQGIKASICEDDFGPVFASTVETIQFTCDNFVPQG